MWSPGCCRANQHHDAIKDTNLCGTVSANSCPNMNLQRMFWFWFLLRWLVYLPVTGASILHEGNGTLVAENHVVKSIATLHDALSILQSLYFSQLYFWQLRTWQLVVNKMLGNVRAVLIKSEISLTCSKSFIEQSDFSLKKSKSIFVPNELSFENSRSWKQ